MLLLRQERFAGAAAGILLRSGVPYLQVFPALSRARGVAVSRVNQGGKRDNQDGKFFEGVIFKSFGLDLTCQETI
jgi:hypothetical protein